MEYCTEDNFQISPGLFTHDLTVAQVTSAVAGSTWAAHVSARHA